MNRCIVKLTRALRDSLRLRFNNEEHIALLAMDSSLKFDQDSDIEKRIPYRLCCKEDRLKGITTRPVNEVQINNSTQHGPERLESREVLRLTKVNSVDIIQTKAIQDGNSIKKRSVSSLERRITPSLYLPYLLVNKEADIPTVFNKATYRSFRTQEERRWLAFTRSLQRDHKQLVDSKDERLVNAAVIDISNPAKLHSRYNVLHLRSARQPALRTNISQLPAIMK